MRGVTAPGAAPPGAESAGAWSAGRVGLGKRDRLGRTGRRLAGPIERRPAHALARETPLPLFVFFVPLVFFVAENSRRSSPERRAHAA